MAEYVVLYTHRAFFKVVELIIFVGLQASGKSTFYRARFTASHELVSKDLFRNNKNPNRRQTQLIEAALQAGNSLVVDNTNPTDKERRPLIQLGHEYEAKVVGYYFESHLRQCLRRNRQRPGKEQVPDVALYATTKKLIHPSYSEGFDELYSVRITGDSTFEITYKEKAEP